MPQNAKRDSYAESIPAELWNLEVPCMSEQLQKDLCLFLQLIFLLKAMYVAPRSLKASDG